MDEFNRHPRKRLGEFRALLRNDLLGVAFAPVARLQPDQDVAAILLGGEHAHLGAGPSREAGDFGRVLQDRFDAPHHPVRFGQRRPDRRPVVDDIAAFVHLGQEPGFEVEIQQPGNGRERDRDGDDPERARDRAPQDGDVPAAKPAMFEIGRRVAVTADLVRSAVCHRFQQIGCGNRNEQQGVDERQEDRAGQRERQRREELSDHALIPRERNEHDDGGQRRADNGADQLVRALLGRPLRRLSRREMPMNVFHDHNRIVDDQADGDGEAAHRHQVDRAVGDVQDEERADDGQRQRHGGDQRGAPVAQEREQHANGQQPPDHDGFAHAPHRLLHEGREVVHLGNTDRRRQRRHVLAQRLLDAIGNGDDVAANLPCDGDDGRRLPVAGNQRGAVHDTIANLGDVADVHRSLVAEGHDDATHIVEAGELAGCEDQVLLVVLRQASNRRHLVRVRQRFGHIVERQLHSVQPVRIDDHRHLALLGGGDFRV